MGAMKAAIRGFISCILPCGALDVIRIVHSNGRVEEFTKSVRAEEVMKAHPKHVLKRSSLSPTEEGVVPRIIILSPDAELQRGKIYFLMPVASPSPPSDKAKAAKRRKKKEAERKKKDKTPTGLVTNFLASDQYLSEILSEKISPQRDQRRGRVGVWRPHLDSILETSSCES